MHRDTHITDMQAYIHVCMYIYTTNKYAYQMPHTQICLCTHKATLSIYMPYMNSLQSAM